MIKHKILFSIAIGLMLISLVFAGVGVGVSYTIPTLECSEDYCKPVAVEVKGVGRLDCRINPNKNVRSHNGTDMVENEVAKTDKELKQELVDCEADWIERVALREQINQDKDNANYDIIPEAVVK